ncbi:MAG: GNAT family N-acetyltransferase [Verrucomicrobiae bacterium]|nr:GNAT family N-acetyltransferase [Verrucomicrobiae bacterium]
MPSFDPSNISIRKLSRDQFESVIAWAAREGWNPGLHDAEIFWQTDPDGHYGLFLQDRLIGSGSVISYKSSYGFMGLFIMDPEFRGQGLGHRLWFARRDILLSRLRPGSAIGMDGVFAMQPFYARGGFVCTHRNLRMEGVGKTGKPGRGLVELSQIPFEKVLAFDCVHFGLPRPEFLKPWIVPDGGRGLGLLTGGELTGMGVVRPCRTGFKIGPLFAQNAAGAETIFNALSNHAVGQPLFLDLPENNPDALALAQRQGMKEVFGCARMYYGPRPRTPWERIYGVTTFELG